MDRVYSQEAAYEWFLSHASGSVVCVQGEKEKVCSTWTEVLEFYQ